MRIRYCVGLLTTALTLACTSATAGDLEDGAAAIENKDYKTARKLLTPLAQQGNREARRIVGLMYMYELGVPRDYLKAHMWWSLAASQRDAKAAEFRDIVAKQLTPAQLAESKKMIEECTKRKFKGCD